MPCFASWAVVSGRRKAMAKKAKNEEDRQRDFTCDAV